ncbi:MAG: DUF5665 domain-containing protein [Rhodobacterales bacterium]|nr:DUF5665 domain-containing protein [Rhodobacterales bacterium]
MSDDIDVVKSEIARLSGELEKLNQHRFVRIHNSIWRLILFQFMRGLAFGLGSVIGATILVSLLAWWVSQFEFLPIIGEWAAQIVEEIEKLK